MSSDIIEDTGDAYIVPHGNHFHYIPKSDLSASELAAAQAFLSGKGDQLSTVEYRSSRAETRSSVRTSQYESPQNPAQLLRVKMRIWIVSSKNCTLCHLANVMWSLMD